MTLEDLPTATEALYRQIVGFQPIIIAMSNVLAEYDVTETAVRARFEAHYRVTPEEVARRHVEDHTINGYLERFREANSNYHPSRMKHLGKRFYFIVDDRRTGGEVKKWFRFLISHGQMVVTVDEITHSLGDVLDSLVIDDIARQIGWKRWSHWPDVGPQPSKLFGDKRIRPIVSHF